VEKGEGEKAESAEGGERNNPREGRAKNQVTFLQRRKK